MAQYFISFVDRVIGGNVMHFACRLRRPERAVTEDIDRPSAVIRSRVDLYYTADSSAVGRAVYRESLDPILIRYAVRRRNCYPIAAGHLDPVTPEMWDKTAVSGA